MSHCPQCGRPDGFGGTGCDCHESFDVGMDPRDFGKTPDRRPVAMPRFANTDPELAWWNGEPEGREPA